MRSSSQTWHVHTTQIQICCNKVKLLLKLRTSTPWKNYFSTAFSHFSGLWRARQFMTLRRLEVITSSERVYMSSTFLTCRWHKVLSNDSMNAQHWKQMLDFSLNKGYPVLWSDQCYIQSWPNLARKIHSSHLWISSVHIMQRKWTYIAEVAIKYLYIVVDYFKSLQFIVFCVHTHAEIQTCIPAIPAQSF